LLQLPCGDSWAQDAFDPLEDALGRGDRGRDALDLIRQLATPHFTGECSGLHEPRGVIGAFED